MSNNIYNILNKLKAVAGLDKPAEPTAPKQPVYESVEARGSITETVKALESKYASFKEAREHNDKDSFDANAKVGDTYKTAKGTVTKTDKGIKHERGVGKHDEEDTELDESTEQKHTITRKDPKTGYKETQTYTGPKLGIPKGWKLAESRRESEYDANEWLGGQRRIEEETLDEASNAIVGVVTHRNGRDRVSTGTLAELVQSFSYTLEVGKSYERERGNAKINMNPKNIEALVKNIDNAKNNAAANGYSGNSYRVATPEEIASATATAPDAVNEEGNAKGNEFNYQLLGRLRSDCDYFLGAGNRSERQLWAGNVADQIAKMKELWGSFPEDSKPQWLSLEDIMQYEKDMGAGHPEGFGPEDEVQDHDLRADPSKPAYIKKVTEEDEGSAYVCVHVKKGKCEVHADSSYGAAKKAAQKWGLKSTAGIDCYLADKPHSPASLGESAEDFAERFQLYKAMNPQGTASQFAKLEEGKIDDLKDAKAEKEEGNWWDDKKAEKKDAKTVVKGKAYGGSKQKDDEEKDELDEAFDAPEAPDADAIARRKRLQALKDKREDGAGAGDDWNEPLGGSAKRVVKGRAYGNGAEDDLDADTDYKPTRDDRKGKAWHQDIPEVASNLPVHGFGKMQGKPDARYSIRKEFNGSPKAQHVARFADEYISGHDEEEGASTAARAHKAQRDATLEGVEFGSKIKNSQAQLKKVPMKLKESKMLNENLDSVLSRFPHEVKQFESGSDIDDDLYHALYDYYFSNGEMPYGVAKARSGDPMEWVSQQLQKELGIGESIVDVHQSNIPSPTNAMPVSKELDEIAALAGLARPVATAVATNVASNLIDETADSSEVDEVLAKIGSGELDAYDVMNRPQGPAQVEASKVLNDKYNDISVDYRLHPDDQFEEIIDIMCNQLSDDYPSLAETEQESEFFRNPLGTRTVGETDDDFPAAPEETEPVVLEQDEDAVPRERDIEYTNSPREKTAGVQAAIPSGTDQSRVKKQYRKEYPGDNHMAVKEDALWKSYQAMINGIKK